ncbi:MAG: hypothetical protein ACO2PP_03065 [Thermocrinis sp.]|uniref:hypothetical protein n=1 Tax=Thermocrinis sp. TaxID=2024383 RepID=UPI003C017178
MGKLLEFVLGTLLGAFVGFLVFEGLFGEDPVKREGAKRSQKANCKAYEESLMVSQSPQEFEHRAKLYSSLCKQR